MVAWAQREPGKVYPAWWEDEKRVLARRLKELNFILPLTETHGLPQGMRVERESWKALRDVLVVYDGAERVYQRSNLKPGAAEDVAEWIELYQKECEDIMDVSAQGLALLKELVASDGGKGRAALEYHGTVIAALAKKKLIRAKGDHVEITSEGLDVLRELPEFDEPISAPTVETSPPTPLLEERGEEQSVDKPSVKLRPEAALAYEFADRLGAASAAINRAVASVMGAPTAILDESADLLNMVAADPVDAALDEVSRQYFDELRLVRVVMADGIGLDAVVTHCGSEIMGLGGTVIKLQLSEALLREIYPPLVKFLEGHNAIGVRYSVLGDLQIVVERPLEDSNEQIPFGLT